MEQNTGTFTLDADTKTITFNHGLSKLPTIIAVYTPDPTTPGGTSPTTFRSIIASFIAIQQTDADCVCATAYSSSGTKQSLIYTYWTVNIDSTSVTLTTYAGYSFKAGKEYTWRAIV